VFDFSFDILKFLAISSGLVTEDLSKRHINLFISQHQTSYILLCIRSLLHAVHTSSGYRDSFYAHCTNQRTVGPLTCNKLELSEGNIIDVTIKDTRQCPDKI